MGQNQIFLFNAFLVRNRRVMRQSGCPVRSKSLSILSIVQRSEASIGGAGVTCLSSVGWRAGRWAGGGEGTGARQLMARRGVLDQGGGCPGCDLLPAAPGFRAV